MPNGVIDSFQIIGNLVNSVVAASVGPNPATQFYDQPAGAIEVGFTAAAPPATSTLTPTPPNVNVQTSGVTNVNIVTTGYPAMPQGAQLQSEPVRSTYTVPPFANSSDPELPQVLAGGSIKSVFCGERTPASRPCCRILRFRYRANRRFSAG